MWADRERAGALPGDALQVVLSPAEPDAVTGRLLAAVAQSEVLGSDGRNGMFTRVHLTADFCAAVAKRSRP